MNVSWQDSKSRREKFFWVLEGSDKIEAQESEKLNEKLPELLCECVLKRCGQPSIYGSCFS